MTQDNTSSAAVRPSPRRSAPRLLAWAALGAAALGPRPGAAEVPLAVRAAPEPLDFPALAGQFFADAGRDLPAPGDLPVAEFFDGLFDRVRLGAFELAVPFDALGAKDPFEDVREVSAALLESQRTWLEALHGPPKGWSDELERVADDLELAGRWVGGWKFGTFSGGQLRGGRDLRQVDAPPAATAAALDRLDAAADRGLLSGAAGPQGEGPSDGEGSSAGPGSLAGPSALEGQGPGRLAKLVLVPDRTRFVQLAAVLGHLREDLRSLYWIDGVRHWTSLWIDDVRVVALQFADDSVDDYTRGQPMDFKNPLGLVEQVVQIAHRAHFDATFGDVLDPALSSALSNTLVIDQFGEVDTRTDGDLASRRTEARSVFVPGAPSSGGFLPKAPADSPWRVDQGADYFQGPLRASLQAGGKDVRAREDKRRAFQLRVDALGLEQVVSAPFLGPEAKPQRIAEGLTSEWPEFTRAYMTAFVHWLRERAGGKPAQSRARFEECIARLAGASAESSLLDVLAEVYGRPLSDGQAGEQTLEGEFLEFLAKGR